MRRGGRGGQWTLASLAVLLMLLVPPGSAWGPVGAAASPLSEAPRLDDLPQEAERTPGSLAFMAGPDGARTMHPITSPLEAFSLASAGTPLGALVASRALQAGHGGPAAPAPAVASEGEPDDSRTFRLGFPGGDLTGDGLDDVLLFERSPNDATHWFDFRISALNGTDGTELWAQRFDDAYDAYPIPVPDATGDGTWDVVLVSYSFHSRDVLPTPFQVQFVHEYETLWRFQVVEGPDGGLAWSREFPGRLRGFFPTEVVPNMDGIFAATNYVATVAVSGDHDGDGAVDLVFNTFDVARHINYHPVLAGDAGASSTFVATRASVKRGPDGADLFTWDQPFVPGGSMLLPVGDSVGDGRPDLARPTWVEPTFVAACLLEGFNPGKEVQAWLDFVAGIFAEPLPLPPAPTTGPLQPCVRQDRASFRLEMLDGGSFEVAWDLLITDPKTLYASPASLHADVTGDGAIDLLLTEWIDEEPWIRYGIVNGADGAVAWRPAAGFSEVAAMGSVDGGTAEDVAILTFVPLGPEEVALRFVRADGATGAPILETETVFGWPHDGCISISAVLFGRRGAGDEPHGRGSGPSEKPKNDEFRMATTAYVLEPVDLVCVLLRTGVAVESGTTGKALYARSTERRAAFVVPVGDLDGRSGRDILDIDVERKGSILAGDATNTFTLNAVALPKGRTLWARVDVLPRPSSIAFGITGDLFGDGTDDLVYSRIQEPGDLTQSRVDALDGGTGASVWGTGFEV